MRVEFEGLTPLIQVFDMPASIHFYRDVLGFEVVTASGPLPDCDWALLRRDRSEIMLNTRFEAGDRPAAPDPATRTSHMCVEASNELILRRDARRHSGARSCSWARLINARASSTCCKRWISSTRARWSC